MVRKVVATMTTLNTPFLHGEKLFIREYKTYFDEEPAFFNRVCSQ